MPKSRLAVVIPRALNTLLIVERVIEQFPFSSLQIWERLTPIRSPNSSCAVSGVRF